MRVTPLPHSCRDTSCTFRLAHGAKHVMTCFFMNVINRWLCITWETESHFRTSDLWNCIYVYWWGGDLRHMMGWLQGFKEWVSDDTGREHQSLLSWPPLSWQVQFHPQPYLPFKILLRRCHAALSLHQRRRLISFWASFLPKRKAHIPTWQIQS